MTMQEISTRTDGMVCPYCGVRFHETPDAEDSSVTHYECLCGYSLGVKRDADGGIVAAWKEE